MEGSDCNNWILGDHNCIIRSWGPKTNNRDIGRTKSATKPKQNDAYVYDN